MVTSSSTTADVNADTNAVLNMRFGTRRLTLEQVFDYFYGDDLPGGAPPADVRDRLTFLSRKFNEASYEKMYSKKTKGSKEVDLWNTVLEMIKTAIRTTESFNMSLCSEARFASYERL
jgi:hypothetical protein